MPKNKKKSKNNGGPKKGLKTRKIVLPQKNTRRRNTVACPSKYKKAAKAFRDVVQNQTDLASAFDMRNHNNRLTYSLAFLAASHQHEIDYLMTKFKIFHKTQGLDQWDVKVIMAEMIWGTQQLKSTVSAVEAVKYYEETVREACLEMATIFPGCLDKVLPKPPIYVRVNELQITVEDALRNFYREGWKLLPPCNTYSEYSYMLGSLGKMQGYFMRDFHMHELLVFPPGISFYKHRGYLTGKLLLQDKGSCLASYLLNPTPGSTVLDLCAAPGFKTNHLANLMHNNGLLYANDIHPERFEALSTLLKLTNVQCANLTMQNLYDIQVPQVDYILVDPSCTYSGIFSKLGNSNQGDRIKRSNWSLSAILRYTLQSFPTVKRVVYTTCSIFPAEGEKVVDDALKEVGDSFTLVDLKKLFNKEWMNQRFTKFEASGQQIEYVCGSKCLRTFPEYDFCQGYFIAMFERNFEVPVPPYVKRFFKKKHSENTIEINVEDVSDDMTEMIDFTSDDY